MRLIRACLIIGFLISLAGCRNNMQHGKAPFATKQPTQTNNHKNEINSIDTFVQTVNAHKHSFIIEKTILGTDDGGQLTGYYDRQGLRKIDIWLGMSNNSLSQQFYFQNGRLIYMEQTRKYYSWDRNKGKIDRTKTSKIKNERYYFLNGIFIQHIPNGKKHAAESDVLNHARMYIKLLSLKENTVYLNQ